MSYFICPPRGRIRYSTCTNFARSYGISEVTQGRERFITQRQQGVKGRNLVSRIFRALRFLCSIFNFIYCNTALRIRGEARIWLWDVSHFSCPLRAHLTNRSRHMIDTTSRARPSRCEMLCSSGKTNCQKISGELVHCLSRHVLPAFILHAEIVTDLDPTQLPL
jgi:hypothetical protein